MLLIIEVENCEILNKSVYNNYYFKIPLTIDGCDVVFIKHDDITYCEVSLGKIIDGVYIVKYYINIEPDENENIYIETSELSDKNLWT